MKKEASKKSKKWLWLVIGLVVLVAAAAAVALFVLGPKNYGDTGPTGGRPELYWNLDKAMYTQNSESGLSTREPGEDGVYRVRFAYNGQQVELEIADKQLVNFIDTMDIMGLVKNSDDVVVDVIDPSEFAMPIAQNAYVQQVMSDRIIANSSIAMNGMQYTIELSDLTEIYNVSETADVAGEIIEASEFQPMDSIWVYANELEEITHVYMTDHPDSSPVYWRAYQMWNSSEKSTSRVPDENGVYSIDFCADGEIVTLKCKDKSIVTSIDNKSPHSCHFGFLFDEEGYIVEIMNSGIGIRGAVAAERIEVQELDGTYFSGTQLIPSDGGLSYSAALPEDCIIYDASSGAMRNGVQGQAVDSLRLGDRICVWTDPMGTPKLIYIANRLQDVPAYFNIERKYDNTKKESTREPDWAGYYSYEFVETGKTGKVTLKTKDKELANFIDSIANRVVGLRVNNGIIENAYTDDDVFGWTSIYGGYVPQIQGSIVSLVSFSKPDSPSNVLMGANAKCYDVSGKDVPYGTEATLRVGDIATVTRDVSSNGVVVYITRRMVGGDKVYYNLDYQYNSTTKETKRLPNEEGYYVFTMAHNGKQVEVKTKDRELANKIEKSMSGDLVCVMRVVNGIVYELYETPAAYGQSLNSGWRVSAIHGDGTYTVMNSTGTEKVLKMADDCIIYNTSYVYDSHRGERIYSLQVGDMVTSLADYRSNVKMIWVRYRTVDKMYANPNPMYDSSKKTTLREPDADGWYWFDLSQEGVMKRFKTNDVEVASLVDSYLNAPFGLRVKDDVILNAVAAVWVRGVYKAGVTAWDVTSVRGNNATIKHNKPGYSTTGDSKSIYVGGNVKVYDISPTAEVFGQKVKVQVGDRIRTYVDRFDNCVYVFVTHHATRVNGTYGYCEHCDQEVLWHPWAGESWDGVDCHYYVNGDLKITKQTNVGNATKDYGVVLDLNGKSVEVNGARAFLARYGDELSILDSVGGGIVKATGTEGGNGGTILVGGEGILNLYSGTLSFIDSDIHVFKGAVVFADSRSTFNMYGGTIKDGIVNSPTKNVQGGNIYLYGSTMNMYDGVIEGGRAERTEGLEPAVAAQGGNIYSLRNAVVNIYGGEIRNGYSNQHGGNMFLSYSTLNMTGGKVYGGECRYSGGNYYSQFSTVSNISGGTIEKGVAGAYGNNFYGAHDVGEMYMSGGLITGDMYFSAAKKVEVSGAAKITAGEKFGISLPSALDLTLGELKSGAEIYVNANGAFTVENPKAQSYLDAGYIKPGAPRTTISVIDNVMFMQGELAYCEHCGQNVEWTEWMGTTNPASGHYFLAKDFSQVSQLSIKKDTDVVLDLYGNTYTSEKIRNFLVRGTLSIMDSVGGGEMISTGGEEFAGAIALVGTEAGSLNPAGFNLYSGTLRLTEDHPTFNNGGLIMFSSNGELNMYGGAMIGGYVAQRGGCVNLNTTGGTMNIYGGTISGGTAGISGGCLDISGNLNIEGGVIDGEIFAEPSCRGLSISGAPEIGLLTLSSGIKANIEGMTDGASVVVNASGTFTQTVDNAVSYLPYFKLAEGIDGTIRVSGGALTVGLSDDQLNDLNSVYDNAVQMTTDGVFSAGGTVTAVCPACGTEEQWVDLADVPPASINEDTHYYLSRDIEISTHFGCYANICVHLNGHNITSSARAFYVDATSTTCWTLNIMGDGTVSGAGVAHATIPRGTFDVGGSVNFFGGTHIATGNYPVLTGRGYYGRSVVNVYEGTQFSGANVSILARSQAVNMYGGTVTSGTIQVDGATTCEVNLNNVVVSNSNAGQYVINAAGEKGALSLNGTTVNGSVVAASNLKALVLSGKTVIDELYIGTDCVASVYELEDGTDIGVSANGAFTAPNENAADYLAAGYFHAIVPNSTLRESDDVLYMDVEKVYCEHCGQEVVWSVWPGSTSPKSGHYYIGSDYSAQTVQWSIAAGTDVVLDLMGNTYSTSGIRNFLVRGSLSVVDTVGGGEMVVTGDPAAHGAIAMVSTATDSTEPATFNLYSGTLRMASEHAAVARGGLFQVTSSGILNMYGGTIRDGAATEYGGNISVGGTSAKFYMYGGEILGGSAPSGKSVYVIGSFYMEGGLIEKQVAVTEDAPNVKLSGAIEIGDLTFAAGKIADVTDLASGAMIGVTADGVFTNDLTDAASYLQYFKSTNKANPVVVEGNALAVIVEEGAESVFNEIHIDAEKMTDDGIFNAGGEVTAECPYCAEEVTWTELQPVAGLKIATSGHYYLNADYEITNFITVNSGVEACLHLNGHNISSDGRAIHVAGHLNLMGKGTLSGAAHKHNTLGYWGTLDVIGSVNLFGGTITGTNEGSAITARGNTAANVVTMYDGCSVIRNTSVPGLGVRLYDDAEFVMYGGSITGGTNNVIVESGKGGRYVGVTVYGGTIESGTADLGGNIYASGAYASINILGGKIIDGDVYATSDIKELKVSGKPEISALNLTSGLTADITDLEEAARVKVLAEGAFTKASSNALDLVNAGAIAPASAQMTIRCEENVLYMDVNENASYCEHCDQVVEWTLWAGITSPKSGHYYIDGDYTGQTKQVSITDNTDVVLNLNGHKYTTTGIRNFLVRGKLSIMDTVGGGEMVTSGDSTCAGTIALVLAPTDAASEAPEINLYSGTLKLADEHAAINNGGIIHMFAGTFNMYGGIVTGGETAQTAGNIGLDSTNTTFNMYGGMILGGTSPVGGSVNVKGTMNMTGGEIEGEVALQSTAVAAISNMAQIGLLNVSDGVLVDVSGLTTGAEIGIVADGQFTKTLTNAESYVSYFTPEEGYEVKVVGDALSVISQAAVENPLNKIHEQAEKMTEDNVFAAGGVVTAVCPVCGTEEQWVDITSVATPSKISTAGHFYLSSDLEITKYYGFYADACLHLNGHNITSTERAFYVDATSTTCWILNIMGEGTVSGSGVDHASIPRGTLDIGGTVNLFGGNYVATGSKNPVMTARGYNGRSVTNIYDGASFSAPAVNLLARSHAVNMYGGELTNGYVMVDGASTCSFNLFGGTITNGNADQDQAIVASGSKGTLTINGGTVNGTVVIDSTLNNVTVGGAPVVTNLDLTSGKLLTVDSLTGGEILVSANGVFTETVTAAQDCLYFIGAAEEGYEVVVENNALAIQATPMVKGNKVHEVAEKMTTDGVFTSGGDVTAVCPVCEKEVIWKNLNVASESMTNNKFTEAGHYYLAEDADISNHFSTYYDICLHLNGHNITSSVRALYAEYVTVNIMGEGVVTGSYNDPNKKGYAATIDAPANVNLYGGTYTATNEYPVVASRSNKEHGITMYEGASIVRDATVPGVNVRAYDHGDFTMYGGLISGGVGTDGGNVLLVTNSTSRSVVFTIYGGIIENGTATRGGNVFSTGAAAVVNICGGTIRNGDVYADAATKTVSVSGAPVVTDLNLTSGKLLSLGVLRKNAQIAVSAADGVFTDSCDLAKDYQELFTAVQSGKVVKVEGKTLSLGDE